MVKMNNNTSSINLDPFAVNRYEHMMIKLSWIQFVTLLHEPKH